MRKVMYNNDLGMPKLPCYYNSQSCDASHTFSRLLVQVVVDPIRQTKNWPGHVALVAEIIQSRHAAMKCVDLVADSQCVRAWPCLSRGKMKKKTPPPSFVESILVCLGFVVLLNYLLLLSVLTDIICESQSLMYYTRVGIRNQLRSWGGGGGGGGWGFLPEYIFSSTCPNIKWFLPEYHFLF